MNGIFLSLDENQFFTYAVLFVLIVRVCCTQEIALVVYPIHHDYQSLVNSYLPVCCVFEDCYSI